MRGKKKEERRDNGGWCGEMIYSERVEQVLYVGAVVCVGASGCQPV